MKDRHLTGAGQEDWHLTGAGQEDRHLTGAGQAKGGFKVKEKDTS